MSTLLAIGLANALAAAVLALPALLISRSRRRPALAHALWLLVLLKLVTPPLFNVNLPWLPAEPEAKQAESKPAPLPVQERRIELADLLVPPPAGETRFVAQLDEPPMSRTQPATPRMAEFVDSSPAVEISVADVEVVPQPEPDKSDPLTLLLFVWLAGTLFVVGRAVVNVWRFQRLLAHARLAPTDVQAQAKDVALSMGMRSCPQVWLVPGPLPPMVWAVGRARILFPAGLLDRLDAEARASLLAHELAHVRRRDHWVRWLELVVLGLYWWYPLAWIARRQMQAREEECCDAWAARHSEPRVYATAILDAVDFLAEAKPRLPAAASPLHTARSLRERLTLIMSGDSPRRLGWVGRLTLLVLALSTLPLLPSLSRRVESAAPVVVDLVTETESAQAEPTDYNHVVNLVQGSDDAFSVTYSPDGKRIAAGMGNARRPGLVQVWDALTHKSLFQTEHPRGVSSVGFSHDSKRLTWATWGGLVRTDRIGTYEKAFSLQLTGNHRAAYSGDGKYLALAGEDRSLRLLDATTGELKRTLRPEPTALYCVTFSPSNKWLAVGGGAFQQDGPGGPNVVSILDVETGKLVTKLDGHDRVVLNVAFAPKEDLIATASFDHTVRVFDGKSFKLRMTLKGHTDAVKGLAFSPDGKTLATGSWDKTVRLWDPFAGKELATLEGHVGAVREIAFSPDGKYLVTGGARRSVKLWDVKERKEVVTLRQDDELPAPPPAIKLAVSPNGKTLATGNEDGTVTLRDAITGRVTRTLLGHNDVVMALAFSRDGKRLATADLDGLFKVWDVATGKVEREFKGHDNWVTTLAFSSDGNTLASGSYDKTVRLWNVKTGLELASLTGHKASVRGLAFSPDDRTLASASTDRTVRLWDIKERKLLGSLKGHIDTVRAVLFGRGGKELFSAGEDGMIKRWDVADQKELGSVQTPGENTLTCLSLSPGGGTLAAGGLDGFVRFFGARTLSQRAARYAHQEGVVGLGFGADSERLFSLGTGHVILAWEPVPGPVRLFEGHTGPVRVATFSPDGKYLLSCGGWPKGDRTLRLWDVKTGEQVKLLTTAKMHLQSAAFTPAGTHAVAGCDDGTITMWDVNSGKEVRQFTGHKEGVPHLVFSPDCKWLLSSGHDKTMRLWDAKTGKEAMKFADHDDWVRCGAFVGDKHVLSGGRDRKVRLWEIETGKLVKTIDHNKEWVERLAVLPGGKRFLSVGGNAMRLWDLESGKLLRTYAEHGFGVTCVALTKDGRTALTASYDGSTRLWDVETGAELRRYGHHRNWVWSVEVAPDGKTFATAGGGGQQGDEWLAGDDFAVRLWKMPQREKEER